MILKTSSRTIQDFEVIYQFYDRGYRQESSDVLVR